MLYTYFKYLTRLYRGLMESYNFSQSGKTIRFSSHVYSQDRFPYVKIINLKIEVVIAGVFFFFKYS